MAIEALLASPQAAPQPVDTKTVASKPAVSEAKAIVQHQPKPVPQAPKIEINREPIISSKELEV